MALKIFNSGAEILEFTKGSGEVLEISIGNLCGHVSVGSITARANDSCIINLSHLPDGEYEPKLILQDRVIPLPVIVKQLGIIRPKEYEPSYMRTLSLALREAEERITSLEKTIEKIERKVWGESIF